MDKKKPIIIESTIIEAEETFAEKSDRLWREIQERSAYIAAQHELRMQMVYEKHEEEMAAARKRLGLADD